MKIKASFLNLTPIQKLFSIFEKGNAELFIAGGAVRDAILFREVNDIDFATNLLPAETQKLLEKNQIKSIPTGMLHGTITAVLDKKNYEITTYRSDIKTDGRHAEVKFIHSLKEDVKRRDFTINALYVNASGTILDFVGGLKDLEKNNVRFIGNPEKRIQEDYLRILRFFRFSAHYGDEKLDLKSLEACIKYKKNLVEISKERIRDEIIKTISGEHSAFILDTMNTHKILNEISQTTNWNKNDFQKLRSLNASTFQKFMWIFPNAEKNFPLSREQIKRIKKGRKLLDTKASLHSLLYHYGKKITEDAVILNAIYKSPLSFKMEDISKIDPLPSFPIRGQNLMDKGLVGKKIGEISRQLEEIWLVSKCTKTKNELLKNI